MSNNQILKILPKLRSFRFAFITEHVADPAVLERPNKDKVHGGGIRLGQNSGVYLDEPPFSLEFEEQTTLLEVPAGANPKRDGWIKTVVYRFR